MNAPMNVAHSPAATRSTPTATGQIFFRQHELLKRYRRYNTLLLFPSVIFVFNAILVAYYWQILFWNI